MLEDARRRSDTGTGYPRFVENEFRRYLDCGILAHGFARLRCPDCGFERFVAFSCKGRLCPSCWARRAADIAADLVDRVLPEAPYRQWVLSMPWDLRFAMAVDGAHLSEMLRAFLRTLFSYQRLRGRRLGLLHGQTGSITAIQRFGGAINCNPHFHAVLPDGLFVPDPGTGRLVFAPLPPPAEDDVAALAARIALRLGAIARRHREQREPKDALPDDEEACVLSSAAEAVQLPLPATSDLPADHSGGTGNKPLCARVDGFSLHAASSVAASDRAGLERLLGYGLRAPFALDRFSMLPDGRVRYRLRRPWPTHEGSTEIILEPLSLLRRLAALLPSPYSNLIRYHGCFANRSGHRPLLPPPPAPSSPAAASSPLCATPLAPQGAPDGATHPQAAAQACSGPAATVPSTGIAPGARFKPLPRRRLAWAQLLRRVLLVDALSCPRCLAPMVVLALISEPAVVRRILDHLGLPSSPPPLAPPRSLFDQYDIFDPSPPETDFDLTDTQLLDSPGGPEGRVRTRLAARPP